MCQRRSFGGGAPVAVRGEANAPSLARFGMLPSRCAPAAVIAMPGFRIPWENDAQELRHSCRKNYPHPSPAARMPLLLGTDSPFVSPWTTMPRSCDIPVERSASCPLSRYQPSAAMRIEFPSAEEPGIGLHPVGPPPAVTSHATRILITYC